MPEHGPAVEAAIQRELRLLDPEIRRSPEQAGALLHPEFHEFGVSGRHWDRSSVMEALTSPADAGTGPSVTSPIAGVQLAPDLVHLTFDTENNGRHAHRSSLWRLTEEGWQLYFHQGTPFGPGTE